MKLARDKFASEATRISYKELKYTPSLYKRFYKNGFQKWMNMDQMYNYYDHCERFALTKHIGSWVLHQNGESLALFRSCVEAQVYIDKCNQKETFPFPIWAFYIRTHMEKATFEEYCATIGKNAFEEKLIEELSERIPATSATSVAKAAEEAEAAEVAEVSKVAEAAEEAEVVNAAEEAEVAEEAEEAEEAEVVNAAEEAEAADIAEVAEEAKEAEVAKAAEEAEVAKAAEVAETADIETEILDILYEHDFQLQALRRHLIHMEQRIVQQEQTTLLSQVRNFFRWLCVGSAWRSKELEPMD